MFKSTKSHLERDANISPKKSSAPCPDLSRCCAKHGMSLELVAMQSSTWVKSRDVTNRKWLTTVDGRNPANQFSLIVYPIIYSVLYISGGEILHPLIGISPLIMRTPPKNNGFHQGSDRHVNRVKHLKPQFHGGKKAILQRIM